MGRPAPCTVGMDQPRGAGAPTAGRCHRVVSTRAGGGRLTELVGVGALIVDQLGSFANAKEQDFWRRSNDKVTRAFPLVWVSSPTARPRPSWRQLFAASALDLWLGPYPL